MTSRIPRASDHDWIDQSTLAAAMAAVHMLNGPTTDKEVLEDLALSMLHSPHEDTGRAKYGIILYKYIGEVRFAIDPDLILKGTPR